MLQPIRKSQKKTPTSPDLPKKTLNKKHLQWTEGTLYLINTGKYYVWLQKWQHNVPPPVEAQVCQKSKATPKFLFILLFFIYRGYGFYLFIYIRYIFQIKCPNVGLMVWDTTSTDNNNNMLNISVHTLRNYRFIWKTIRQIIIIFYNL